MKLDFIPLTSLSISKANMRHSKAAPNVADLLPSVRKRGVIVPVLVRPSGSPETFEIVAGARRFAAAQIVANESGSDDQLPCAILDSGDDVDAVEASLIENIARLDPDEVTQWETFTRLVKEGKATDDIAATFGLAELSVKRILALGNLTPRIRDLYRKEKIDASTVRHLTLASKVQQKDWLALFDSPDQYAPTGHNLKSWLFGGASIATDKALFELSSYSGEVVADLFGEGGYFADAETFWAAQNAAIEERKAAYLEAGWSEVVIVPPTGFFSSWEYDKTPKKKGGKVYVAVRSNGEVAFHEGYLSHRDAQRKAKGEGEAAPKVVRPELSGPLQSYADLHRHAAVRSALTGHPAVALRLMVAHVIAGSSLWSVRVEPQSARSEELRESVETSQAETAFDAERRKVLALVGFDTDEPTVIHGSDGSYDGDRLTRLFLRLLPLTDAEVMAIIAVVMGESLAAGSVVIEAVGPEIGVEMRDTWAADEAFFALLRDRELLTAMVGEVAGEAVAEANTKEKGAVLKAIIRDCLDGSNGRAKVEGWVPRFMSFPPSGYTARGGVGTVSAALSAEASRPSEPEQPDQVEALAA